MSDKKASEETVTLNLVFDDGSEEVEISMQEYLNIEMLAKENDITFEEQFNKILNQIIEDISNESKNNG